MSNIIDIQHKQPHKISEVVCVKCFQRWIAIRPCNSKLKDMECNLCGQGFIIETGENIDDNND